MYNSLGIWPGCYEVCSLSSHILAVTLRTHRNHHGNCEGTCSCINPFAYVEFLDYLLNLPQKHDQNLGHFGQHSSTYSSTHDSNTLSNGTESFPSPYRQQNRLFRSATATTQMATNWPFQTLGLRNFIIVTFTLTTLSHRRTINGPPS
ncbi:hypothetical protein N7G274_001496 [Stereocaulon virgatum]|uniref:Uncharacterized protein n=1 Tax=Stereocaulon virgatum TaxID=373712 RepID=A0ABR4AJU8_9LECA